MGPIFFLPLFKLAARLPLALLHRVGFVLGWLTYLLSASYAARLRENLQRAGITHTPEGMHAIRRTSIGETGKSLAELPWVWQRPLQQVTARVRDCHGWEHVEAAHTQGHGIIFLTPHLGCFEVAALYAAARMPITVLYRPPRITWLEELMRKGRMRGQLQLARTDLSGVRMMFKALKRGEAIGLLPDQVPGRGEGEWADFFGRPAYTMTLVGRLAKDGAAVLMAYAERLPRGEGYTIRITPLRFNQGQSAAQQMNAALEEVVRACPAQYLWSYNRYKTPDGVAVP